jgi:hypothetical protein
MKLGTGDLYKDSSSEEEFGENRFNDRNALL